MVQSSPRDPENFFSRTVPIGRFPGSRFSDAVAFPLSQWLHLHDGFNPLTVTRSHRSFTCFPFTRCENSGTDCVLFSFAGILYLLILNSVNLRRSKKLNTKVRASCIPPIQVALSYKPQFLPQVCSSIIWRNMPISFAKNSAVILPL